MGTADAHGPRVGARATIAGRLLNARDFGKLMFAPIVDRTGRLQVGFQRDKLAEWWPTRKLLDGGDIVGVTGELGFTQKGEPTLWAAEVTLLSKSVAPPPEKWHGLVDKELRYRRRYVDLWSSEGVADVFVKRSKILATIRRYLDGEGYLEVETPTLHPIAGGAAAKPFVTHHNALGMDLFLRIAPELYLKRLIVGGLERVFEISRNFRNEGLSARHNPEFTMLELYEAQADYRRMMDIAEQVIVRSALAATGATAVSFRGKDYDLHAPFPRRSYVELFRAKNGFEFDDAPRVKKRAADLGLPAPKSGSESDRWKLMNDVFEATVEDALEGPVLVVDYPVQISPLAKQKPGDPRLTERFEVFVAGMELGNAFSELNDPAEQARRFEEQVASKDPEAPGEVDWDYVQALEYGMPPAGGLGIGIDRLVMVLTGQDSIRDVLLFPAMKPQGNENDPGAAAQPA
jgi:lysyl-tRNA synthetase class 2